MKIQMAPINDGGKKGLRVQALDYGITEFMDQQGEVHTVTEEFLDLRPTAEDVNGWCPHCLAAGRSRADSRLIGIREHTTPKGVEVKRHLRHKNSPARPEYGGAYASLACYFEHATYLHKDVFFSTKGETFMHECVRGIFAWTYHDNWEFPGWQATELESECAYPVAGESGRPFRADVKVTDPDGNTMYIEVVLSNSMGSDKVTALGDTDLNIWVVNLSPKVVQTLLPTASVWDNTTRKKGRDGLPISDTCLRAYRERDTEAAFAGDAVVQYLSSDKTKCTAPFRNHYHQ